MANLTLKQAKAKLEDRRRHISPQLDNAAGWQRVTEAVIVGEKESKNGCLSAAVAVIAVVVLLAGVL
jgi:hypothetical protein